MGQKVSSISLRLGKRLSWSSLWTAKDTNYGSKFVTSRERQHYLNNLFNYLGIHVNELFILNSNKPTRTVAKVFNHDSFSNVFDTGHLKNSQNTTRQKYNIKDVSAISRRDHSTMDIFLSSLTGIKRKRLERANKLAVLPVFNAQILADYIAEQVGFPENQKSQAFRKNLLSGVAKFTIFLLKKVKLAKSNVISGLKIECSGKWKQTASGRKQKLIFIVGNIKAQSLDQFLSFGFSTISTKFGSCSFKVWVCFK